MRAALTALVGSIALVATATPARADALDEFGFGARASGMAGAYTAAAAGVDAAHYNPGAVPLAPHPAVLAGYGYGAMQLDLNGDDAPVLDVSGGSIGLVLPFHFDTASIAFGLSLYLPDRYMARIQLVPATEPHFGLLDNDPSRIVVEPVFAARIGRYISFGGGVSLLADAAGNGITFNVGVVSGDKVGQAAIDVSMPMRTAPLAGLLVTPNERTRIGVIYRGELSLDLALDILANVDVANVVTGDALVTVRATNYFTPQKVAGGIAVDVLPDLTLAGDLQWNDWSAHPGLVPDLRVLVNLDTAPPLVQSDIPAPTFEDTFTARVGAEWRLSSGSTDYAIRTGYAYVPSPVLDQTGVTSVADNDRHVLALGFGATLARWKPILKRPVGFDVAAQWHHLSSRLTSKDAMTYPGPAFSSGGDIFYLGTTMKVDF